MKLIQNIDVYAPQHLGKKDVLTINDKIVNIAEAGSISADGILSDAEVIDGNDLILTPGFIDSHVHVLGGGGEGGFANSMQTFPAHSILLSLQPVHTYHDRFHLFQGSQQLLLLQTS